MAKRKYFKVTGMDMQSVCRNSDFPERYRVDYLMDKFVKPTVEGTRLFVFGTLEAAQKFVHGEMSSRGCRIFECEVKDPHQVKYIANPEYVEDFWKAFKKAKAARKNFKSTLLSFTNYYSWQSPLRSDVPSESYAVTEVKLVKEVEVGKSPFTSWY